MRGNKKASAFKALEERKIAFSPNPTTGDLSINIFTIENNSTFNVCVQDITGKTLMQQRVQAEAGLSSSRLNIQDFVNGIYIVKVTDEKGNIVKTDKIILNK